MTAPPPFSPSDQIVSGRSEFPAGYSAIPNPLTVLDARGRPVAAVGDLVTGGGGWDGEQQVWRGRLSRAG